MFKGLPQLNNSQEMRARDWAQATDDERNKYTSAMDDWKRDYPNCARVMNEIIGKPRF